MNGLDHQPTLKNSLNKSSVSNVNINININKVKHPETYVILPLSPKVKKSITKDFDDGDIEIKRTYIMFNPSNPIKRKSRNWKKLSNLLIGLKGFKAYDTKSITSVV
jgi:hypothetical protein